jgi:hypothetical protein
MSSLEDQMPWTTEAVGRDIETIIPMVTDKESAVGLVMGVLLLHGYDSIDREKAFSWISRVKSWDYEDLYQIWLHGEWEV